MQYFKFNPVLVVIGMAEPAQQIGDETKKRIGHQAKPLDLFISAQEF